MKRSKEIYSDSYYNDHADGVNDVSMREQAKDT